MKSPSIAKLISAPLFTFCVAALVCVQPTALGAATYTWDGNGNPSLGGNWTEAVKWNPDAPTGGPGSADTATLGNTEANRVINYDTGASGSLDTLIFEQTSAFINTLNLQRSLSIAKALTLSASNGGTSELSIQPGAAAFTVTVPSVALNTGGLLTFGFGTANVAPTLASNVTMNGGTLNVKSGATGSAATAVVTGTLGLNSGTITLQSNSSTSFDTRLQVNNNFTATGGSLTRVGSGLAQFVLQGATNSFGQGFTFDITIATTLQGTNQSLTTDVGLGTVFVRAFVAGPSTKTITSSVVGQNIGQIRFGNGVSGGTTNLVLGSNLTTRSGVSTPIDAAFFPADNSTVNFGIDVRGFLLDLSASTGSFAPNTKNSTVTANYALTSSTGSAGTIRAAGFNFGNTNVNVSVGPNLTLDARGGNASANNLNGPSALDPSSTFLYSGNAAAGTPATLTANRSLGNLTVGTGSSTGTLRLPSAITAAGNAAVNNGATLDLQDRLSAARITVNTGGTLLLTAGSTTTTDRIGDTTPMTLAGGRFNTSGLSEGAASTPGLGALTLTSSSIIDLGSASSILAFANSSANTWTGQLSIYNWTGSVNGGGTDQLYFGNTSSGLNTSQLDSITFFSDSGTTSLGIADILSTGEVVPVPEPSTYVAGMLAVCAAAWSQRRRLRGLLVQAA